MIDTKKIRNKHGFTLVEIIVVLVILAILAAVAIPSVLGYVDEAKKAGIIQEAHGIYEAAQIAATKCYATDEDEFKKQSIFKYNYTLPADFPYKKTIKIQLFINTKYQLTASTVNPLTIIILVKPMDLLLIYSITNKVR